MRSWIASAGAVLFLTSIAVCNGKPSEVAETLKKFVNEFNQECGQVCPDDENLASFNACFDEAMQSGLSADCSNKYWILRENCKDNLKNKDDRMIIHEEEFIHCLATGGNTSATPFVPSATSNEMKTFIDAFNTECKQGCPDESSLDNFAHYVETTIKRRRNRKCINKYTTFLSLCHLSEGKEHSIQAEEDAIKCLTVKKAQMEDAAAKLTKYITAFNNECKQTCAEDSSLPSFNQCVAAIQETPESAECLKKYAKYSTDCAAGKKAEHEVITCLENARAQKPDPATKSTETPTTATTPAPEDTSSSTAQTKKDDENEAGTFSVACLATVGIALFAAR